MNHFMRKTIFYALLFPLALSTGCNEPIYQPGAPAVAVVDLPLGGDLDRLEWPQRNTQYIVARPPQLAYVTSFDEKLEIPWSKDAELVPWETEGLEPWMVKFLNRAYKPIEPRLDLMVHLKPGDFVGTQAFDVSTDGRRLVVIDDKGLAMYRTKDGKRQGQLKLPPEIVADEHPHAIRFCGPSNDMLVATKKFLYRISSRDGSLIGKAKGFGELVADWKVTRGGGSILVRSESGRLFAGDSKLEFFSVLSVEKGLTFDSADISEDGNRVGVWANAQPRIYTLRNHQVVDKHTFNWTTDSADKQKGVAFGEVAHAWIEPDSCFNFRAQDQSRQRWQPGGYSMLWKPRLISTIYVTPDDDNNSDTNSFLIVGERRIGNEKQVVLFEHSSIFDTNSLPQVLDELPTRISHSTKGDVVAVADSQGVRLYQRSERQFRHPLVLVDSIKSSLARGQFNAIQRLLDILKTQTRLGYGRSPVSLRSTIINTMALHWSKLEYTGTEKEALDRLKKWEESGSKLAISVAGIRHLHLAWLYRGTSTQIRDYENFMKHIHLANQVLDKAILLGDPPLYALHQRIHSGLEATGKLTSINKFAKQAADTFRGELEPHRNLCFKLQPKWYGEPGDSLSFAMSVAKTYRGGDGDYMYARLAIGAIKLSSNYQIEWAAYDKPRFIRGFDEIIRRDIRADFDLWRAWLVLSLRDRDKDAAKKILRFLLANTLTPPSFMQPTGEYENAYKEFVKQENEIWAEKTSQSTKSP